MRKRGFLEGFGITLLILPVSLFLQALDAIIKKWSEGRIYRAPEEITKRYENYPTQYYYKQDNISLYNTS